ncbi:orf139 [Artaxa digramma nucleopolyhedrovirus]|uniref:Orf139 n=1 Tax=Artaxa digramma nucleopolyhedrovirus TaxID=3070910 RepID=A0AAE6R7N5_9ABAC|nr:orf139 [Euproctis digramma nucleopolyhedrovirus]QHB21798.1 orf139 [Artaxa digramma nucleopolyhedrovirus]
MIILKSIILFGVLNESTATLNSGDDNNNRAFDKNDFPKNMFEHHDDDIASAVVDSLTDDVCVPKRFAEPDVCDGAKLLNIFENQIFNFRKSTHVKRYGAWLRLLNNMEFYAPHAPHKLMEMLAVRNHQWAIINSDIDYDSKKHSAEVFRWTADTWVRYHNKTHHDTFENTVHSFINFFNTFVIWCDVEQAYFIKTIMYAYKYVRSTAFPYPHKKQIDNAAANTIRLALNYPLSMMSTTAVKQLFYMSYVNQCDLQPKELNFFRGYYEVIRKNVIMPRTSRFDVIGGAISYYVHHNVDNLKKVKAMRVETQFVYNNTMTFFKKIGVAFDNTTPVNITVYVHDNKKMYEAMGPLWIIPTNNGGYTHKHRLTNAIESHVYYENDLLPRNYGHELQHTLMYLLDRMDGMPTWFVEGVANRFGNRKCYNYDVDSLKSHLRTTNISNIVDSDYGRDDSTLYGMGSVLVQFLYETQPALLGKMIVNHNFKIHTNESVDDTFQIFKINKILECEKYKQLLQKQQQQQQQLNESDDYENEDDDNVNEKYVKAIVDVVFEGECRNYIGFEFDDVYYYMTPTRLVKSNLDSDGRNAQKQIRFNFDEISHFDYEWFLKGALKQTLKYFGDYRELFKIDSLYTYKSKVFCGDDDNKKFMLKNDTTLMNNGNGTKFNAWRAIAKFTFQSGVWNNYVFLTNKTYNEAIAFVKTYYESMIECKLFINPPVINYSISSSSSSAAAAAAAPLSRLLLYVNNIKSMTNVYFTEQEKRSVVDIRNNTLAHLAALFNHKLYALNDIASLKNVRNCDNRTPQQLYTYALRYQKKFNKKPSLYCYTELLKDQSDASDHRQTIATADTTATTMNYRITTLLMTSTVATILLPPPTTSSTIQQNFTTTTIKSIIYKNSTNDDHSIIGDNEENIFICFVRNAKEFLLQNKTNVVLICIIFVIFIMIILLNTCITIQILKCKLKMQHNKIALKANNKNDLGYVSYKKNSVNVDDECEIKLFN